MRCPADCHAFLVVALTFSGYVTDFYFDLLGTGVPGAYVT